MDYITVNNAIPHEVMTVIGFKNEEVGSKLLNIGVVPGVKIQKMLASPFGDSYSYKIGGQIVVLRDSESNVIFVN